jgi:flagellar hook-basal body complex protein FliE
MQPISGVSEVLATLRPVAASAAGAATQGKGVDFTALLKDALAQVGASQETSTQLMQRFQTEDPNVSIEETMIAMQKSNIGFQALIQTRNKLVSAYNDIMNMQI